MVPVWSCTLCVSAARETFALMMQTTERHWTPIQCRCDRPVHGLALLGVRLRISIRSETAGKVSEIRFVLADHAIVRC